MGGAFVGLADDAPAVYWNPAGLAGGSHQLGPRRRCRGAIPDGTVRGSKQSTFLLAASMPALGSYYRLHHSVAGPEPLILPEAGQPGPRSPPPPSSAFKRS